NGLIAMPAAYSFIFLLGLGAFFAFFFMRNSLASLFWRVISDSPQPLVYEPGAWVSSSIRPFLQCPAVEAYCLTRSWDGHGAGVIAVACLDGEALPFYAHLYGVKFRAAVGAARNISESILIACFFGDARIQPFECIPLGREKCFAAGLFGIADQP